jgi:hypothetical protein
MQASPVVTPVVILCPVAILLQAEAGSLGAPVTSWDYTEYDTVRWPPMRAAFCIVCNAQCVVWLVVLGVSMAGS